MNVDNKEIKENNDLISVIVPVYNVESYLRKCLDSIVGQTYKKLEIILVDDGSTDGSGSICDEYAKEDHRIKVIHKDNDGVSSARNIGIDNVKGKYILFVDADDIVNERYVEILYIELLKHKVDIVFCGIKSIYVKSGEETIIGVKKEFQGNINKDFIKFYRKNLFLITAGPYAKIYKANIIKSNNLKFDESYNNVEDYLFNLQYYSFIKPFYVSLEVLYYYYHYGRGSAVEIFSEKRWSDEFRALSFLKQWLEDRKVAGRYFIMTTRIVAIVRMFFEDKTNRSIGKKYYEYKELCKKVQKYIDYDYEDECKVKHYFILMTIKNKWYLPSFTYYYIKSLGKE